MTYASAKDGIRLYYEEAGSGTPLLFIHDDSARLKSVTVIADTGTVPSLLATPI